MHAGLQFLFPKLCPVCDKTLEYSYPGICASCEQLAVQSQMQWREVCTRCNLPTVRADCEEHFCRQSRIFFDRHLSLYYYKDPRWKIVTHKWKFRNDRRVFELFLRRLWEALPIMRDWQVDRLVYIESVRSRLHRNIRTFQPCADLAQQIAHMLGQPRAVGSDLLKISEPAVDVVDRREQQADDGAGFDLLPTKKLKHRMKKQSHQSYRDRFLSIHNSIILKQSAPNPRDKTYLLVEDIYTTGATANEVARRLKLCAAKRVYVISALQAIQ